LEFIHPFELNQKQKSPAKAPFEERRGNTGAATAAAVRRSSPVTPALGWTMSDHCFSMGVDFCGL
jgi:hypothetical protein